MLPDALLVNFQTVTVNAVPDAATGSVRVSANPWPANLALDNNVRLDPGACRRGAGGIVVAMPEGSDRQPHRTRRAATRRAAASSRCRAPS